MAAARSTDCADGATLFGAVRWVRVPAGAGLAEPWGAEGAATVELAGVEAAEVELAAVDPVEFGLLGVELAEPAGAELAGAELAGAALAAAELAAGAVGLVELDGAATANDPPAAMAR